MTELTMSLCMLSKPKLYQIFSSMRRKSQKGATAGQFVDHLFFSFFCSFSDKYYLFMIFFVHPSIYLVRICLFFVCLFWGEGEGGGRFHILFVLCLLTCPSSPTQSHSPPRLPILMRWCRDKTTILSKHFPQSLRVCFIRCRYQYDSFITYSSIFGYLPLKVSSWIWVVSC